MSALARSAFRKMARGPGRHIYGATAPVLRMVCTTAAGRAAVEFVMRAGGRALLWAFDAQPQPDIREVRREWLRVLRGIGLNPESTGESGCATCFARCTLDLGPGDGQVCDTVMSINDEMLRRLGGLMVIEERLTDPCANRCLVRIEPPRKAMEMLPGERPLWFDESTAENHFDGVTRIYDFIMGYFEIPANWRALRRFEVPAGGRVLELGVGTGLGLLALLRRLPPDVRVTAVDRSAGMLEHARQRIVRHGYGARVDFLRADAAATGLAEGYFDAVYSSFLLDLLNLSKRQAILAEARRLLREGGQAQLVVMDAAPKGRCDRALTALYNFGYARWNPVWMALCGGYAPHCRPVRLAELIADAGLSLLDRAHSHVTVFPVAILTATKPMATATQEGVPSCAV